MKTQNLKASKIVNLAVTLLFIIIISLTVTQAQESEAVINARIAALTAKISAAPKDDSLYDQRGMAYLNLGKTAEALADANSAISINPKNTNALFLRGQIKGNKKDYDGAIADHTPTINAYPDKAFRAYMKRGEMYEKKGDKEMARADYAKALEISKPKSAEAAESLARVGGAANAVQSTKITNSGSTSSSNNGPPEITMDAINRQAANMTPQMRGQANRAANSQLKPEDYKLMEVALIEQDVKKKYAAFRESYAITSDANQQYALLNGMKADYQKAIADTDKVEKQNASFSAEQKTRIAVSKKRYSQNIELINAIIADNKARAAPGYKPANEYDLTVESVNQTAFLMAPSALNTTTMYFAKDTNQKLKQQIQEMQNELKTATDPKRRRQLLESGKAASQKALTEALNNQKMEDITEQNKQILGTMISNYEALIKRLDEVLSKTPQ